jgi:hypothetical protein
MANRSIFTGLALVTLLAIIAVPAFAVDPSPSPGAGKPAKSPKAEKVEKAPVTLAGTLSATTDAEGKTAYTLQSGGTTYALEAGPAWFFGDNHPLKAYVGKTVTVVGEKAKDTNEVDVESVNGKQLRAPGKPPWAGGWKRVGKVHPGWSQEKEDRFKAKFGDCWPPGHCKAKPNKAASSPAP